MQHYSLRSDAIAATKVDHKTTFGKITINPGEYLTFVNGSITVIPEATFDALFELSENGVAPSKSNGKPQKKYHKFTKAECARVAHLRRSGLSVTEVGKQTGLKAFQVRRASKLHKQHRAVVNAKQRQPSKPSAKPLATQLAAALTALAETPGDAAKMAKKHGLKNPHIYTHLRGLRRKGLADFHRVQTSVPQVGGGALIMPVKQWRATGAGMREYEKIKAAMPTPVPQSRL